MATGSLSDARLEVVRGRALDGAAAVLSRGRDLTYANVAAASGVPERTLYRHFPTRADLLAALFEWANQRVGFRGEQSERPVRAEELTRMVRAVFPGFDAIAPVICELLVAPEGRVARLADKAARQKSALEVVRNEVEGLDRGTARKIAAVLQLLTAANSWRTLRDYWDMDGAEAAEASALAIELVLEGARARAKRRKPAAKPARARRKVAS